MPEARGGCPDGAASRPPTLSIRPHPRSTTPDRARSHDPRATVRTWEYAAEYPPSCGFPEGDIYPGAESTQNDGATDDASSLQNDGTTDTGRADDGSAPEGSTLDDGSASDGA
jgi:hypothetical protein